MLKLSVTVSTDTFIETGPRRSRLALGDSRIGEEISRNQNFFFSKNMIAPIQETEFNLYLFGIFHVYEHKLI